MSEKIHNLLKIQNDNTTFFTDKELKMIDDYINELELLQSLFEIQNDYIDKLEEENKKLNENYDRIYNKNCILREKHNINDIGLLDENYKLKKVIDKAIKFIEDTYYSKNTTDIDSIVLSSDKLIKVKEILKEVNK